MGSRKHTSVASTDKTTNLEVPVTGELSVDEMESVLLEVATELGMHFSRITTLGTKRYPGNRHWHLKQNPREPGCLDITYWPQGALMWISMRNYEPEWVHESGHRLGSALKRRLTTTAATVNAAPVPQRKMPPPHESEPVSLDELRLRLTESDLIPSQEPLLEHIAPRFASLEKAGVTDVASLWRQLKNPKSLEALAAASGVDADYLILLRRALRGFFPKPRALKDAAWLEETVVSQLAGAGIKNTDQFNQAVRSLGSGTAGLEQELGLDVGVLADIAALADLSRVQWMNANFAGALIAAGYRSAAALTAADAQSLSQAVAKANDGSVFYKGVVGQRDFQRVIEASRYVDWVTRG